MPAETFRPRINATPAPTSPTTATSATTAAAVPPSAPRRSSSRRSSSTVTRRVYAATASPLRPLEGSLPPLQQRLQLVACAAVRGERLDVAPVLGEPLLELRDSRL